MREAIPSLHQYALIAWCSVKREHKDNLPLPLAYFFLTTMTWKQIAAVKVSRGSRLRYPLLGGPRSVLNEVWFYLDDTALLFSYEGALELNATGMTN